MSHPNFTNEQKSVIATIQIWQDHFWSIINLQVCTFKSELWMLYLKKVFPMNDNIETYFEIKFVRNVSIYYVQQCKWTIESIMNNHS